MEQFSSKNSYHQTVYSAQPSYELESQYARTISGGGGGGARSQIDYMSTPAKSEISIEGYGQNKVNMWLPGYGNKGQYMPNDATSDISGRTSVHMSKPNYPASETTDHPT